MSRIAFFIDGFNLFHALDYFPSGPDHSRYHRFKWVSLTRLSNCYVTRKDKVEGILYFTTLATWNPEKVARHKLLIRAQEIEGVEIV